MTLIPFFGSDRFTLGVELEMQILSVDDYGLTPAAPQLLDRLRVHERPGGVTHEITESMLEVNTGVNRDLVSLVEELRRIRDALVRAASDLGVAVSGGGAHPALCWPCQTISGAPRAQRLYDTFGYLAKQWTVFGQHVHIGCSDGDEAIYLLHALSRYVPHFVALAAASPYNQGADTGFDCSRLNYSLSFPLSGRPPRLLDWQEFVAYFERLEALEIVGSTKDLYWDIRPKPEFGTVEVRVCDTPLTVERAAVLAAYMQALSAYLLRNRPEVPLEEDFLTYSYSRFTACRFGLEALYIDPTTGDRLPLRDHILTTLEALAPDAARLGSESAISYVRRVVETEGNDARWIRRTFGEYRSARELMREQSERWTEDDPLLGW